MEHCKFLFVKCKPGGGGGCVIDDDVAFADVVPRFDASVQVIYSSVFVLPSDMSVRNESECLENGCWSDDDLAIEQFFISSVLFSVCKHVI